MNFKTIKFIAALLLTFAFVGTSLLSAPAFAQGTNVEKPPSGGPRRQLGTIIYAGLGGAVLGLSTLSFYGRPQDKLANIAIGFAVGVIAGTVAVTYNAATNPDDFYGTDNRSYDLPYDREMALGPAPSMMVVANKNAGDSAPALSASYELFKF